MKQEKQKDTPKAMLAAYFTLEAAMILPIAIAVVFLCVYLLFFQYDRCLADLNVGAIAMRAAAKCDLNDTQRVAYALRETEVMYDEQYAAWLWNVPFAQEKWNRISLTWDGKLIFPFDGLSFWSKETTWKYNAHYENNVWNPTSLLRTYRKMKEIVGKGA